MTSTHTEAVTCFPSATASVAFTSPNRINQRHYEGRSSAHPQKCFINKDASGALWKEEDTMSKVKKAFIQHKGYRNYQFIMNEIQDRIG